MLSDLANMAVGIGLPDERELADQTVDLTTKKKKGFGYVRIKGFEEEDLDEVSVIVFA